MAAQAAPDPERALQQLADKAPIASWSSDDDEGEDAPLGKAKAPATHSSSSGGAATPNGHHAHDHGGAGTRSLPRRRLPPAATGQQRPRSNSNPGARRRLNVLETEFHTESPNGSSNGSSNGSPTPPAESATSLERTAEPAAKPAADSPAQPSAK